MSQFGVVVLGAGRWGTHLVRIFANHPQARLVAVADAQPERLTELAQRLQLDRSVMLTPDWQAALTLPEVDGVAIATPASTHYPLIQAALQQGLHVLAEKPLTLDPKTSADLCRLAAQQQRQLVIDHTYLFHGAVQQGRQVIAQGDIGQLRYGYAARTHLGPVRQDVDALWDLAIHDIAIFNHWLQRLPVQVQAQGTGWLQPEAGDRAHFPQGLSDLVWVQLTYPHGFQAVIHLCWLNPDKQRRLCVVGDRGTLVFDEMNSTAPLTLQQGRFEQQEEGFIPTDQSHQVVSFPATEPLRQVCDHFLESAQQDQVSPLSSGLVGTQLVYILSALHQSLNQGGKPVSLDWPRVDC